MMGSEEMALVGKLSEYKFIEVLRLIHQTNKSGRLIIERPNEQVELFFLEGQLSQVQSEVNPMTLADGLIEQGHLDRELVSSLCSSFDPLSDPGLAAILADNDLIERGVIERIAGVGYLSVIQQLFLWEDGAFRFEPAEPLDNRVAVGIGLEKVILEGEQRLIEWESLKRRFPNLEVAVRLTSPHAFPERGIRLNREEWRVVAGLDGRSSLTEIAKSVGLDDFQIRWIARRLVDSGLVEVLG